jgi:hypothetical protein
MTARTRQLVRMARTRLKLKDVQNSYERIAGTRLPKKDFQQITARTVHPRKELPAKYS